MVRLASDGAVSGSGHIRRAKRFRGSSREARAARYQLRELNERFRVFTEAHPYRLIEKFELRLAEEVGDYLFVVESVSIPKREWGVLIGELVHNLRSALDHTAYAAAKSPSDKTQFPIFTRREDWDRKAQAMIQSIPDEITRLIEEAQPYHAPEDTDPKQHLLAILNRLSNHDKHHLLHTAVITLEGAAPGFRMTRDVSSIQEIAVGFGPLEPGATLVRLTIGTHGPQPKVEMYGEFALGVAFTDPTGRDKVIEGHPVFDVLLAAERLVNEIVIRAEIACKS